MGKIQVGIIGVGNCASSLVQGVQYYRGAREGQFIPGLMHLALGGYHVRDIEFTVAVDIDRRKVGKDLAQAIFEYPNNTTDEPSVGLSPKITTEIYDLLIRIARMGTTIMIVDQNIMKALEISDFMYLLDMGQVKKYGPKKDFESDIRQIIRESLMAR